ncbi:uncharacterized protein LOC117788035 [Drosophila innubila]|uniref:uncharacterized protein LOC117788035 n=1 Tax=Drosophila innubila TaxID=198719 RepID=UPI00148D9898|nr:uncharacterized protein LOC117788035 [Drosophila innubila]
MRFICATIAVILVASVGATIPERTYLPPSVHVQHVQPHYISRPVVHPHNVYLPPVQQQLVFSYHPSAHVVTSPVVHQVVRQQQVYQSPVANYHTAGQHVVRPNNVYLPPATYQRPVVQHVVHHQRAYESHFADYRPAVQHVVRPQNVYLPPATVHHPIADYNSVVRPQNTYLPPAGIDLRSDFADRR